MATSTSAEQNDIVSPLRGYENQALVPLAQALQPLVGMVPDIKKMVKMVESKGTHPTADLSSDEVASIMLFTLQWETKQLSFRSILNQTLRTQTRSELRSWFPFLRLFIGALYKLPPTSVHTVYRALKGNASADYPKGERVVWWGLASCKLTLDLAVSSMDDSEPRTVFIIECDAVRDISNYSDADSDMVLYPMRQFEVVSSISAENHLCLIQLKEIQTTPPLIQIPPTPVEKILMIRPPDNGHSKQRLELLIDSYAQSAKVNLIKQRVTDADAPLVVKHAIEAKQCRALLLSENLLTAKGASIIAAALPKNKTLQFLSLANNPLSDEGVISLAKTIAKNTCVLTTLSLYATETTDEGVKHICTMLADNAKLTWLHLGGNQISDHGVELLADVPVKYNKTLVALDLSRNASITDASVESLAAVFKGNTSLNTLWINRCSLSPAGKKKLEESGKQHGHLFVLTV